MRIQRCLLEIEPSVCLIRHVMTAASGRTLSQVLGPVHSPVLPSGACGQEHAGLKINTCQPAENGFKRIESSAKPAAVCQIDDVMSRKRFTRICVTIALASYVTTGMTRAEVMTRRRDRAKEAPRLFRKSVKVCVIAV